MHNPTKKQWATVIENFYRVYPLTLEYGEGHLDMEEPYVNNGLFMKRKCGTVHCVAGWYAIATLDYENKPLDFVHGANSMALDLGFNTKFQLETWASQNRKVWGNSCGVDIFYDPAAWGNAKSIEDIIHYLEGVHDRTPE